MKITKPFRSSCFFLLHILGLGLFLLDKISPKLYENIFYSAIITSMALYLSDRLKSFKLLQGMEFFELARDDVREYMFEVYELQLSNIISTDEMSIPIKESKARSFDVYMTSTIKRVSMR